METTTKTENDGLIEEMLSNTASAPEPGEDNRIVHKGDEIAPVPIVADRVKSAGWVKIWDTRTGEVSITNRNMLMAQLKKKREDGSRVFTTQDPHIKVKRGNLKCMLHADDPNRAYYDSLGLPVCPKSNLTSPYQVLRHMQKRHKTEWETLEQERKTREHDEQQEYQRSIVEIAQNQEPKKKRGKSKE